MGARKKGVEKIEYQGQEDKRIEKDVQKNRKKDTETIPYSYSILIRNSIHYCYGIRIWRMIKIES